MKMSFSRFLVIYVIAIPILSCGTINLDDTDVSAGVENSDAISDQVDNGQSGGTNNTGYDPDGNVPTSDSSNDGDGTTNASKLNGIVFMGPVEGATVSAYVLADDGTRGELLASTTTASDGSYEFDIELSGPVMIVATGGTYIDEATGESVVIPDDYELVTLLSEAEGMVDIGVTALTTIAASWAVNNTDTGIDEAITSANEEIATAFGLEGVDIVTVTPDDLTDPAVSTDAESDSAGHGMVLAAFTQMASDNNLTAEDLLALLENFIADYADGGFDGKNYGQGLKHALQVTPEQALNGLTHAVGNFLDGHNNNSGIKSEDRTIVPGHIPKEPKKNDRFSNDVE